MTENEPSVDSLILDAYKLYRNKQQLEFKIDQDTIQLNKLYMAINELNSIIDKQLNKTQETETETAS